MPFANGRESETKDYGTCTNCDKRPATHIWVGEGGFMDYNHGNNTYWCEQCVLEAQIQHARAAAERLPELEGRLIALRAAAQDANDD